MAQPGEVVDAPQFHFHRQGWGRRGPQNTSWEGHHCLLKPLAGCPWLFFFQSQSSEISNLEGPLMETLTLLSLKDHRYTKNATGVLHLSHNH